jgi:tripartite-type tricarboxylate transporter receptor subunit TctC
MIGHIRWLAISAALSWLVATGQTATSQTAAPQEWPQRQIRMIVSFGAGGGADIIGRILAEGLQDRFGKPVVVENKPGAGGIIGNEAVAKAAPDGYTMGMMTAGQIIAAVTRKSMPYDTETLTPVARIADASLIIATRPDFPANDVRELVRLAKADPGKIVFVSPGFAATQHFAGELFKQIAGVNLLHVPYRTTPEAIAAVLGKQADVLFDTVSALIGQVNSGGLKGLAVIESGVLPGYDVTTWYGVFGPPGIPTPVVARLNHALNELIASETVRNRLAAAGVLVRGSSAEEFGSFMAAEFKRWNAVREAAGIALQ